MKLPSKTARRTAWRKRAGNFRAISWWARDENNDLPSATIWSCGYKGFDVVSERPKNSRFGGKSKRLSRPREWCFVRLEGDVERRKKKKIDLPATSGLRCSIAIGQRLASLRRQSAFRADHFVSSTTYRLVHRRREMQTKSKHFVKTLAF